MQASALDACLEPAMRLPPDARLPAFPLLPRLLAAAGLTLGLFAVAPEAAAAEPPAAARPAPNFLYVLRLPARLQTQAAWTPDDQKIVGQHFEYLKQATAAGQVLLAGRTNEPLDKTFGLVIFQADNEAAAQAFMQGDPAVAAGVMTATLHPYALALMRQ
jgi:uncharacterized protein